MCFDPYYPGTMSTLDEDTSYFNGIRRPAAAYHFEAGVSMPDYFAVTWEKTLLINNIDVKRVVIMAE